MKPTKTQLNLAAKLYELSMAANAEAHANTDNGCQVQEACRERAHKLLHYLDTWPGELRTPEECLQVAMRLKPE